MLRRVVHAGEHHVLDEHAPVPELHVAGALAEHLCERVAVVDGHEAAPQRRRGRVEREREADRLLDLVDEPAEPRQPADGGDRRAAVSDAEVRQAASGGEHRVEVQHRLAHPHEDEVVDRLDPAEVERLVEDLARRQVPAEPHLPGGAEVAGERTARLGRNAHRAAPAAIAHQDRLDRMAVVRPEEDLERAVLGECLRDGRE